MNDLSQLEELGNLLFNLDNGLTIFLFKLIALVSVAYGLCLCFFGYKIQRVLAAIYAGIVFGAAGYKVVLEIASGNSGAAIAVGAVLAVAGAIVGFKFYKQMIVFLTGLTGFSLGVMIVQAITRGSNSAGAVVAMLIVGVALGFGFGWIMAKIFKPLIIITTAIQGGMTAGYSIYALFAYKGIYDFVANWFRGLLGGGNNGGWVIIAIILIVLGSIFQFKTVGRKVSDFIAELKSSSMNVNTDGITQNTNVINSKNSIIAFLNTPLKLILDIPNLPLYFLGGAILLFISIFRLSNVWVIIQTLCLTGIFSILFLMYKNKIVPYIYTNSAFVVVCIISAINVIASLVNSGSIYGVLLHGGIGLFAVALWLSLAKDDKRTMLFVVSGGLVALNFILVGIKGTFSFLTLGMICANIPFIIPFIKKYTSQNSSVQASIPQSNANEKSENNIYCKNCGKQLEATSKFCNSCGTQAVVDEKENSTV